MVRVGDTVRRPAGPWTPAVQALLAHLRDAGVRGVPRPLGLDDGGREVLSFVPGEPVFPDRTERYGTDAGLTGLVRFVRRLHDALAEFRPPPDARWQVLLPAPSTPDLIVHHDLAPWNVLHSDRHGWGLVDWDGAGPGTREWELALVATGFVPLFPDAGRSVPEQAHRLRVLADAYGLDEQGRHRLLEQLVRRPRAMYDLLASAGARDGLQPWARLWREGHGRTWWAVTGHVRTHAARWRRALLDS